MYYYAFINSDNIVEQIVSLPSQIFVGNYIPIDSDDQMLIGKRYNAATGEFEEVTEFYYAQLNEKGIVTGVFEMPSEVADPNLIRVTSLNQDLVGMYYNAATGEFIAPPVSVLAELSTAQINHGERWLGDVLDEKAKADDVYTKTQADDKFALKSEGGGAGASAYDIAVANGFVGTQAEWLASLKGEKGDTGAQGLPGEKGDTGAQGLPGEKGEKGDTGEKGAAGEKGEKGDAFTYADFTAVQLAALKGDKGDKGDTGARGATGATGADGQDFGGAVSSDIIRLNGTQAVFKTDSMMTFGTNNLETMIAGSKIYSKVAIQVSSDERLKEAVKAADTKALAGMVDKINIVRYKYKGDSTEHIGVIAQDMLKAGDDAALFVGKDATGYYAVSMAELVFPLIAAVQELSARVKALEKD